jgi:hypothetical protein
MTGSGQPVQYPHGPQLADKRLIALPFPANWGVGRAASPPVYYRAALRGHSTGGGAR